MAKVGVKTYDCRKVIVTYGGSIITGFAEDSFVSIEPNGEGTTHVVGCDGEVSRSLDPDRTFNVKIALNQTSDSNSYLRKIYKMDRITGTGILPLLITDLRGGVIFQADQAWIKRHPSTVWGKSTQNREYEFGTGESDYEG